MKKLLPIFFAVLIAFSVFVIPHFAFAATTDPASPPPDGSWTQDSEVTFVGKNAARSAQFLKWTLANYDWVSLQNDSNPLIPFWITIRNIVYAFSTLFVLITAFLIILTRGRNITLMRFVPRFILIILLVTLSFSLVQFIYQSTDIVQSFFLKSNPATTCPPDCISDKDLLSVSFDYENFVGLRRSGISYDESAFTTLLLTKITAVTYYTMTGVLILRKVILWFFVILSPLFPILLLYNPLRNTARVWFGEFLRWVLYAPLFSVLLAGLVSVWRSTNSPSIPIQFDPSNPGTYPTAVNILLGGPGQKVSINNSINSPDSFALYIVALIMLWVVILLPFLLLQMLLNFVSNFSPEENFGQRILNRTYSILGKEPPPAPIQGGSAKSLPFENNAGNKINASIPNMRREIKSFPIPKSIGIGNLSTSNIFNQGKYQVSAKERAQVFKLTNLPLPTIREIASYETHVMQNKTEEKEYIRDVSQNLQKIGNPSIITNNFEREKYLKIKENLQVESQKGNQMAATILNAAHNLAFATAPVNHDIKVRSILEKIARPESVENQVERREFSELKQRVILESQKGNPVATEILKYEKNPIGESEFATIKNLLAVAKEKGDQLASQILVFITQHENKESVGEIPVVNKVQTVSLDDYEAVKRIWRENYEAFNANADGIDKQEWIKKDMQKVESTINLLTSANPEKVAEGMKEVSTVLPFFLIGGFSQTEIVAYLKAKLEAGKQVLDLLQNNQKENLEVVAQTSSEKPKEMSAEEEMPGPILGHVVDGNPNTSQ